MKKGIAALPIIVLIILAFGLVFILPNFKLSTVSEQTAGCQFAIPAYGSLVCRNLGWVPVNDLQIVQKSQSESVLEYTGCSYNCKIDSIYKIQFYEQCGGTTNLKISVSGVEYYNRVIQFGNSIPDLSSPISWNRGQNLVISASCDLGALRGGKWYYNGKVSIQKSDLKIEQTLGGQSGAIPVTGSDDCQWNSQLSSQYKEFYDKAAINPQTGQAINPPGGSTIDRNNIPTSWQVGDTLVYVSRYIPDSGLLNVVRDNVGNLYYGQGFVGQEFLYSVDRITSVTDGKTYCIPSSKIRQVQCISSADCNYLGSNYNCDTSAVDKFVCVQTGIPCNSDDTCAPVYGTQTCTNKILTGGYCDKSQPMGTYLGKCINKQTQVPACPSDCVSGQEFYNTNTHTCDLIYNYQNCPRDSCCTGAGGYKPQSCGFGLTCCPKAGSEVIGDCKQACAPKPGGCTSNSDCSDTDPQTKDVCVQSLLGNYCSHDRYCPPGQIYDSKTGLCGSSSGIDMNLLLLLMPLLAGIIVVAVVVAKRRK